MPGKSISFATFNLYNLNLAGKPIYNQTEGWSKDQYATKVRWIGNKLIEIDADVVGLQELWDSKAMIHVLKDADLSETYDLLAPANANGGRIVCAALVRKGLLIDKPKWIDNFPKQFVLRTEGDDAQTPEMSVNIKGFSRPVLQFAIQPEPKAPPIDVFVCHFKSKAPTRIYGKEPYADKDVYSKHATGIGAALSTIRRTAEAAALRFLITETLIATPDRPLLLMGDMNDSHHSNTINILTEQPRYLHGDALGGRRNALYTGQTLQDLRDTRDVLYTHIHQDVKETLDQILVSQDFYERSKGRKWLFKKLVVKNDHLDDEDPKTTGATDHGIVRIEFEYKPR